MRLWISLGCSAKEKGSPQLVEIEIKIIYSNRPRGCHSDELKDVICYHAVTGEVVKSLNALSFHLIECLAAHIFEVVAMCTQEKASFVEIAVTKLHHPVAHVQKGIVFKYGRNLSSGGGVPQTSS